MIELPIKNTDILFKINPSKIIALGLNYHEHIKESVTVNAGLPQDIPQEPILFAKTPNVLTGPGEPIIIPAYIFDYGFKNPRVDYEGELALIVKKQGKNISEVEVFDYILGFSCFNDVSQRNFQKHDRSGWFRGKSLDTFGPIGPVIVQPEDIGDPHNLQIQTRLNGKTVQDSNTSKMIFKIPEIISFISKLFTLLPGDIIVTGTPEGVGPIQGGDVVEIEIQNIGTLKNPVILEKTTSKI